MIVHDLIEQDPQVRNMLFQELLCKYPEQLNCGHQTKELCMLVSISKNHIMVCSGKCIVVVTW